MTTQMPDSTNERGFGLVEAVVATLITAVGVLSVAGLFMVGARMQQNATNSSNAIALVTAELERLRTLTPTAPERLDGGTLLNDNDPTHSARRGLNCDPVNAPEHCTRLRWEIDDVQVGGVPVLCSPVGGIPGAPSECAKRVRAVALDAHNEQAITPIVTSILFR